MMFVQIVRHHWAAARLVLLALTVAAFTLPLASVQGTFRVATSQGVQLQVAALLDAVQSWLPFFPTLAAVTGIALATTAWSFDHRGKHVYALALPLGRKRYIGLKMAAGALLVLPPALALWVGAGVATAAVEIPIGLDTYVLPLVLRFLMAALIAYAASFALSAWSSRGAVTFVAVTGGLLLTAELGTTALAHTVLPELTGVSPLVWVLESAVQVPGPFGVFTGNWSMIDV